MKPFAEILEHNPTYHFVQGWRMYISNIVEKIAIGAQLADDHYRCLAGVLGYTDTKLITCQNLGY